MNIRQNGTILLTAVLLAAALPGPVTARTARKSPRAHHSKRAAQSGARLVLKESNGCRALAPPDWSMVAGPEGAGVDILSPDQKSYAGWSIVPIRRSAQAYYGDVYGGDPTARLKASTLALLSSIGDSNFEFTSPAQPLGYFTMRSWKTRLCRGATFYHLYNLSGAGPYIDGEDYIMSAYTAITRKEVWAARSPLAVRVAASIRGRVKLRVPTSDPPAGTHGGRNHNGEHSTYNAQLGTEYAHSSTTGESFLKYYATDWNDTGADGPGYYQQTPNGPEKLDPGRADE